MSTSRKRQTQADGFPSRVDWRLLEYFRVAGEEQHITRAAERLGTSQPALSRALARLEQNIGVPLFERVGRSVRLTRYGESFLTRIERGLREIEDGQLELAELLNPGRGRVSIGFLRSLGAGYVPRVVRRFQERYPEVRFTFLSNNSIELTAKLLRNEIDLAFLGAPSGKPEIAWKRVAEQELILIVSESHPLARRRQVRLGDVAKEPFLTFQGGHAVRNLTDDLCRAAGFSPNIVFEGDDSGVIRGFVSAGFGVAVTPPENGAGPGVVALRIVDPTPYREIGIAWLEDRFLSASVRSFRDFAMAGTASPKGVLKLGLDKGVARKLT